MFCPTPAESGLCEMCGQNIRGGCNDTPGPQGGCEQAMGRGLLPGKKRMLSRSWGPRRKALLQSGPLSLLQEVSRPAFISRKDRQHL